MAANTTAVQEKEVTEHNIHLTASETGFLWIHGKKALTHPFK
ncbi:hypothetical protein [Paenibacillus harenae]|uniref:Uncharacterized protein n=1 Tax=Paenibacillus harenae TaxID=306543 RepID=A0ABT9U4Z6_PAEHA|nr:hypothetical protein [Paenibacillus harenae]MDQ0114707.1 hypothetical protein [Paenibacillus harenae]